MYEPNFNQKILVMESIFYSDFGVGNTLDY